MRIQDKLRHLINFWTILSGILGAFSIILIYMLISAFIQGRQLQNQCEKIKKENDALELIQAEIIKREKQLHLNDEKLTTILAMLLSACKKSDAGLGEISVGEKIEREGYSVLPIEISVRGSYNQIGKFINIIEREDLRFQFHQVELSTKETKGISIIGKINGDFIIL